MNAKPDSSDSPRSLEISTEIGHHYSGVTDAVYHGSDDETDASTISTMQIRTFADVVKAPAPLSVHERQQFEMKIQQVGKNKNSKLKVAFKQSTSHCKYKNLRPKPAS